MAVSQSANSRLWKSFGEKGCPTEQHPSAIERPTIKAHELITALERHITCYLAETIVRNGLHEAIFSVDDDHSNVYLSLGEIALQD